MNEPQNLEEAMPGKRITKNQIEIYVNYRKNGKTQDLAAAKAGVSVRSGHNIEHNKHAPKKDRSWKTRKDPFESIWNTDVVPLLKEGIFEATYLLGELQIRYPGEFSDSTLRSLQRKIKRWRAIAGPEKEIMFLQIYEPGKLGVSDFTHPKDIKVTINGVLFEHIFYHFRMPYSGFNYMQVFAGSGESYEAFAQGLQEALHYLGSAPKGHRTDSLSASFKNLDKNAQEDLTERYRAFIEHYGMQALRINPGEGHENGTVESSHNHIKNRIRQSLILRGNTDFVSLEAYREFIQRVTKAHNQRNVKNLDIERAALLPLPKTKAVDYTETVAVVSVSSVIDVRNATYSVPSRLIGERLLVRLYNERLEGYLGAAHVFSAKRIRVPSRGPRGCNINYRHIIGNLVRKPGAFRGYRFRDALFPDDAYRKIWEHVNSTMNNKEACKFIVGILHIAATQNCESELACIVVDLIEQERPLSLFDLQSKFTKYSSKIPIIKTAQHALAGYNSLIPSSLQVQQ